MDIGFGAGKLLEKLKAEGKDCFGVESSNEACEIARKRIGDSRIINKKIEDAIPDIQDNYFDLILCLDVLEHLIDPLFILRELRIKLQENGLLISSIPNIRYFHNFYRLVVRKEFDYTDYGVMDTTHLRFFTYKSMKKLFENAGYNVVNLVGINPTPSIKFLLLNTILLGFINDCKYQQYVIISNPIK